MLLSVVAGACCLALCGRGAAQPDYAHIKGRVVWGGKQIPPRKEIKVQVDAEFILKNDPTADPVRGTILDDALLVNPKNQGLQNTFVWLLPAQPGQPLPAPRRRLRVVPADSVVIVMQAGRYLPRAAAMREGQWLCVMNTDAIAYNFRLIGDGVANMGLISPILRPKSDAVVIKGLKAQRLPLVFEDNVHAWMRGRLAVFDHPYFAMTDENGAFEIRPAPVGEFRLMVYHEEIGYRLGAKGKNGVPLTLKPGVNDLGLLPMGS
jgi:hypothetical protein